MSENENETVPDDAEEDLPFPSDIPSKAVALASPPAEPTTVAINTDAGCDAEPTIPLDVDFPT